MRGTGWKNRRRGEANARTEKKQGEGKAKLKRTGKDGFGRGKKEERGVGLGRQQVDNAPDSVAEAELTVCKAFAQSNTV